MANHMGLSVIDR